MPRRIWNEAEFAEFKKWEKQFDRPLWWALALVIIFANFRHRPERDDKLRRYGRMYPSLLT
jgi:hypothetical protein